MLRINNIECKYSDLIKLQIKLQANIRYEYEHQRMLKFSVCKKWYPTIFTRRKVPPYSFVNNINEILFTCYVFQSSSL